MMRATYRLQLTRDFTLVHAREIVPYVHALGVSHLYLSPVLQARPGSTHGYDVADPTRVSAELGGEAELRALADAVHARGMGLLLDVVPNHMGIGPDNPFWEDVLTHGENSPHARWFDVDWEAHPRRRIVMPVLGDDRAAVLARGEIGLEISEHAGVRVVYFGHSFPLDPATLPEELQLVQFDPNGAREAALAWVAGEEGRARLAALLDRQHYALVHWRVAPRGINYRRFFDVNELAALRVEDPQVFAETHALVLRLVEEGVIDGLRIDHVDGLRDPLGYLRRLRSEVTARASGTAGAWVLGARERQTPAPSTEHPAVGSSAVGTENAARDAFPIVVEKILSSGEELRSDWPVQGTTGYEFLNDVETLFIHADGARRLETAYRTMRRLPQQARPSEFADVAREGKLLVLRGALRADMLRLARRLAVAVLAEAAATEEAGAPPPSFTKRDLEELADGLTQLVASLPVYRTYIDGRTTLPHEQDRAVLERAIARAQEHVDEEEHAVVVRVARAFLEPLPARGPGREARLDFVCRFQQTSGPATAKGVEDTALYRYVPLASRNEVGGEPDRPLHDAVAEVHAANAARAARWPGSLLATNTHDTKRSADLRARIDVLSELPEEWLRHVQRWRRLNRKHRTVLRGRLVPDTSTEWLFYQTLVGLWPAPRTGRRADDLPGGDWLERAAARIRDYMMKAVKEAKVLTSWTDPDAEYEAAVTRFIDAVLDPRADSLFLPDVARLVARVARAGLWNALARVVVHYTAPGVPDTYQGDECWTQALVDPDNRRVVDYEKRAASLAELARIFPDDLAPDAAAARLRDFLRAPEDDRLKLLVAWRTLRARAAEPALFAEGAYLPLEARGPAAGHLFAFARVRAGRAALVVVPRLQVALGLAGLAGTVPPEAWEGTRVLLPQELASQRWRSAFTGRELAGEDGALDVRVAFEEIPLGLLLPL